MHIIFITLCDFRDLNEQLIYTDLMKIFIEEGQNVTILSPRERRYGEKTTLLDFGNYRVLKVKIGNVQKTNTIEKGLSTILLERQILAAIRKNLRNEVFELVLYSTPPITFYKIIKYLKRKNNAITYLMLKDIFPQNAVDLNMFSKTGLVYKYFRRKEKNLYSISDFIGCMSQANVDYLLKNNPEIPRDNVEICPNSIIPTDIITINKKEYRGKFGLSLDSVLFIYGGNFGKPQGIDFILEVLKENSNKKDRHFILCGTGTELRKIEKFLCEVKPNNVSLIGGLPKNEYDDLVSNCDVGLIFLDKRFTIPNFPSRILPYMDYGLPVLAASDKNTDLKDVLLEGEFGWWCESSDSNEYTKIADWICNNRDSIRIKGNNARNYLENNYSAKHTYKIIMKHFN